MSDSDCSYLIPQTMEMELWQPLGYSSLNMASHSLDVFSWHTPPSPPGMRSTISTHRQEKMPLSGARYQQAASTSLSRFCQNLLWPRAALFPHKILTELLQALYSVILFHLWKGHKPSYTDKCRYFKAKGNSDFSTMGILTCTACQFNECIQEIWLKSSCFLKLGTVLSAKHARVFHGCDLAAIFALPALSWIRLQAQCNPNTYTQRCNFFLGMLWN